MTNALNLPEVDQEQALELCKFFIRSKQSLFLFGRRGCGKTAIATQAIESCKYNLNYINLSVIERPDLAGYPNMNSSGDVITFKSPSFLPALLENKPNQIILFDEVDKASPEVTAPLLEILQRGSINGKRINVSSCILTGNLSNERSYSNQLSSALLDRGSKYILNFDFSKWVDWAKLNNVHDLILGFLRNHPELACGDVEDTKYASPSPRGWTLASDALIKAKQLKIVDIQTITQIISGFVGNEAGTKFKVWYEHYKQFEPYVQSVIETGNSKLDFEKLQGTEKIVFAISLCHYAKQKYLQEFKNPNYNLIHLENLVKFFNTVSMDKEIKIMGLYNAFDFEMISKYKMYACVNFFNMFKTLNEGITIKK